MEFSNRQVVLRGSGPPAFQGPEGIEYLDESTTPHTRYCKTGSGVGDWTIVPVRAATQQEVDQGTSTDTTVTPATLSVALNDAVSGALGLNSPPPNSGILSLAASDGANDADFRITIPETAYGPVLSIEITGYGSNASLVGIDGAAVGQTIALRSGETEPLTLAQNTEFHLAGSYVFAPTGSVVMQRLSASTWIELSRT